MIFIHLGITDHHKNPLLERSGWLHTNVGVYNIRVKTCSNTKKYSLQIQQKRNY